MILAGLAWVLKIGEVIVLGTWAFKIEEQLTILGRNFVITDLDRPQIALFYLVLTFWLLGSSVINPPPLFIPLSIASVAILISALAVQPILYSALLIEMAILLCVLMLTPIGEPVNRGVQRFLIYQTLGVPFILLAGWFLSGIESEAVRQAIGFGLLFVLTLMVGALVNMLVGQVVKKTGLSGADRVFGVVFGALRGGLIIIVFVVIAGMTPLPEADWWQSSVLLQWFESTAIVIQEYIPEDLGLSYKPAISK